MSALPYMQTYSDTALRTVDGFRRIIRRGSKISIECTIKNKPVGAFEFRARNLHWLELALKIARSSQPVMCRVATVQSDGGPCLRIGARNGGIALQYLMPSGIETRPTSLAGAELDALERAVADASTIIDRIVA